MAFDPNAVPEADIKDRLFGLENQTYVMYLQLNAITKILVDKDIISKELLTEEMDDLNKKISEVAEEIQKQEQADKKE